MTAGQIQKQLLHWFDRHARVLPWRSAAARRDPYRIWVSEIMLQQTQVATVIPYYRRWLRVFPSVRALASAKPAAVLKAWEGLGYYSRARNLHAAAREVVRHHGGKLPADRDALLALPGIGRYTVGAILSIAFGQPEPLVDGNVARVLARLYGIRENVKSARGQAMLWKLAGELVCGCNVERASKPVHGRVDERTWKSVLRRAHPGRFNESLMELGATVCTPQNPRCDICPLRGGCVASRNGLMARLPNVGVRPKSRVVRQRALLIWRNGRVLIRRRPADGLLGGFWEFPEDSVGMVGVAMAHQGAAVCNRRFMQSANPPASKLKHGNRPTSLCGGASKAPLLGYVQGVRYHRGPTVATVRHGVMNDRFIVEAFECQWLSGEPEKQGREGQWRWARPADLRQLPFIGAHRKIMHSGCGEG